MITYQYYPKSRRTPLHLSQLIDEFRKHENEIDSETKDLKSNQVLSELQDSLIKLNYDVEVGKKEDEKLDFAIYYGRNDVPLKTFNPDAYHLETRTLLEIEAGRAVDNNEYIKDYFKALMIPDTRYFVLAVKNVYKKNRYIKPGKLKESVHQPLNYDAEKHSFYKVGLQYDFETVSLVYDAIFANNSVQKPKEGVLLIGY